MLVFASSDKGGTGRSVTSCNIAYRLSLLGHDVAYLDFDFGSPTAGAIFEISTLERGTDRGGLHSYVEQEIADPDRVDVRAASDRDGLRTLRARAGRLVLFPGDVGGAEFTGTPEKIQRCVELFLRLDREFPVVIVDLSAGRSHAVHMALAATATALRGVPMRWLVFHRWTRQHIVAAGGLVFEQQGIVDTGVRLGHDETALRDAIRFVRTAVPKLSDPHTSDRAAQVKWLRTCDDELKKLALRRGLGHSLTLGATPMEPVLQWREQVISDADVARGLANPGTVEAFVDLARKIVDDEVWEGL